MALRITRASDPITVDRLNMVIYAAPGLGKTSLAFTASDPILLDFDNGAYRAANRGPVVQVGSWSDVANITADDLAPFKTVIIDTGGRALDAIKTDIIKTEPKGHKNGALTLPGYGILKTRFETFLTLIKSFGKDVVVITHMDEQRNGDEVIERIDMQGSSKNLIYQTADAMGRLVIRDKRRQLLFSPTDTSFGKNPGQLDPLEIPALGSPEFSTFLADVIQRTKDRLNKLTAAQQEALSEQEWFRGTLPSVDDAEGINGLLSRASDAGRTVKAMLHDRATALGLTYDKRAGAYVEPKREEAA